MGEDMAPDEQAQSSDDEDIESAHIPKGVVNRAHLDYAERILEEFTQSIYALIEDKKNLAQHTHEKKKATLIVILSIRFTKLIIYHLQRKHKFHPRPDSLLHLPNEEPLLRYLKFSAKGTKREVFGMPILGFTATDCPKLQENLKLTVKEHVILKDPACSSRTLSSLQHLTKYLSFGDLFFNDKPSEVDNEKTTAETEAESVNKHLEERLDSHGARLYKLENLDIPTRMWETNSYKTHEDHMQLYEALKKSMNRDHSKELLKDLAKARKKKKKRCDSPKMPHGSPPHYPSPSPPPTGPSGASRSPRAYVSSKVPPSPPPPPSTKQEDDEDIRKAHIPKVNLRQDWWKPLEEERPATPEPAWSIPSSDVLVPKNNWASALASTYTPPPEDSLLAQTGDIAMFMDWFCKRQEITELKPQDLEGPAFKLVKIFHPNVIHLQYQMDECHKLLTDSVDDLILKYNVGKP
nr:hypothetical protein [Tanacetum cinerariifolium]